MPIFAVFGSIRLEMEPDSTVSIADALSRQALNGKISFEKKSSRNEDSADSTSKHQYFWSLLFRNNWEVMSQIACYRN